MLKVNGFYGHVMRNNFRSLWIFLGFAVAFQILSGVILSLILLFIDPTKMIFLNPFGYLMDYGLWVGIFSIVFFVGNLFLYKKNLKKDMQYSLMGSMANPRLHKIVQNLSITAGIQEPEIALINTQARNAFVCGLAEKSCTLVVTEGLLRALDDEELTAVIAHEITHIKNGDIRLMAFANVAMSSMMFLEKLNILKIHGTKTVILMILFPPFLLLFLSAGFVSGIAMTLSKVSRLLIASSREFIADAEAVRLTHNPAALISALQKIEGMSEIEGLDPIADAMMIDGATVGEFATHPTIVERISVLVKHSGGMAYDVRPRKDTRFGAQRNMGVGANSGTPVFGLKAKVGQSTAPTLNSSNATMSVLDRVNVGSDRNVLGLTSGGVQGLFIGFICVSIFFSFIMWHANDHFSAINKSIPSDISSNNLTTKNSTKKSYNKKKIAVKIDKQQKPNLKNNDGVLGLPEYRVASFDLVAVALIAMVFFVYVLIVKSFQARRIREIEKYKLGNF